MGKYDAQVKRLTDNPALIHNEWLKSVGIFDVVGDNHYNRPESQDVVGARCSPGTLDMIKLGTSSDPFNKYDVCAFTDDGQVDREITYLIRDSKVPEFGTKIKAQHLVFFKEVWEQIDRVKQARKKAPKPKPAPVVVEEEEVEIPMVKKKRAKSFPITDY